MKHRASGYYVLGRVGLPVKCRSTHDLADWLRGFAALCRAARDGA